MGRYLALAVMFGVGSWLPAEVQQTGAPASQTPMFRTESALVRVDVYPVRDGRIVPGLTQSDFQLFEDGRPQQIATFDYVDFPAFSSESERRDPVSKSEGDRAAADPRNRVFVVYLDTLNITIAESRASRAPLVAMLQRTVGPRDLFGVLTPEQTYADLVFGRQVSGLDDMMRRNWNWGLSEYPEWDDAAKVLQGCFRGVMRESDLARLIQREQLARTFRRLRELVDYLGRLRQERKNLLVFSHGWDLQGPAPDLLAAVTTAPRLPAPPASVGGRLTLGSQPRGRQLEPACESQRIALASEDFRDRFRELLDAAVRANVSFYPVNPAGLNPDLVTTEAEPRKNGGETSVDHLRELAANTDGIAVVDTNDLGSAMTRITNSLSAYYLLGYYSTNPKQDGSVRHISVKGPARLDLRARRQYRAGNADAVTAPAATAPGDAAADASNDARDIETALSALARIGSARGAVVGRAVRTGASEIAIVAEVSPAGAADAESDIDVQVLVTDRAGASASGRGRILAGGHTADIRVRLPTGSRGPWQVVMRTPDGGEAMTVPAADAALSEPLVMRLSPGLSAEPVAAASFSRRDRLLVTWILNAAASRAEARILDRRGQALPISVPVKTGDDGATSHSLSVEMSLGALAPADYVLELVVTVDGTTTRQLVAFRLSTNSLF